VTTSGGTVKKNVKILASLVRKAKKKLHQGKRDEALELMKKAVIVDDNNGVLVQVIKAIGRKRTEAEQQDITENAQPELPEDSPLVTPEPEVSEMESEPAPEEHNQERNELMSSEDQLNKYFEASDREFQNGHQQKALAYLKKAGKLYPGNPDVQARMDLLKIKLKSSNLVRIARKKLDSGDIKSAVGFAREIFELRPETNGLDQLLLDIENHSNDFSSPSKDGFDDDFDDDFDYSVEENAESDEAEEYITSIRQLVQENSLEEAASLAIRAFRIYPDNGLLSEFVDNFRKLGLLD
jgi:tetratricopeptide (TPR) repeat protein